ncbi:phospholipid scramblase family protein [Bradyrhizobium centrosematis]|uniref:phospholipid scramblase family protein n=1 Tax=Bradyrhizobium centrosematis TaxID=1300039 RepID=UPI002168FB45|nr:phospholipid scramblase family protein [Bradyrhizobium centrosematis]
MLPMLADQHRMYVQQVFEMAELFGLETRNKYRIREENGRDLLYAAEQQKGVLGFLFRQLFGHWRSFEVHFFDAARQPVMRGIHPFRFFFQCLELRSRDDRLIGTIERQFSIFTKRFHVHDAQGRVVLEVTSPLWKVWTFPFMRGGREQARVAKKWSGLGSELFTDRDNFLVEYLERSLTEDERALVLAAAIYIDLMYFEVKGEGGVINLLRN